MFEKIRLCKPELPCGRYRVCDACARKRQKHIADVASALLGESTRITWTRFTPEEQTEDAIKSLRTRYIRTKKSGPGIWTVERGNIAGLLHVNILTTYHEPPELPGADVWHEHVQAKTREIAAYISKQSQIPWPDQYQGRAFGQFKAVAEISASKGMPPLVQARAMEITLGIPGVQDADLITRQPEERQELKSREEYREIALKHLPLVRAMLSGRNP